MSLKKQAGLIHVIIYKKIVHKSRDCWFEAHKISSDTNKINHEKSLGHQFFLKKNNVMISLVDFSNDH